MSDEPLNPAGNGNHGANGRFVPGNNAGRGNPRNKLAQKLRNALLECLTVEDAREWVQVCRSIYRDPKAKPSEKLAAVNQLATWGIGPSGLWGVTARVEDLEAERAEALR